MTDIANIAQMRVTLDGTDLTDRIQPRLNLLRLTEKRGGEADELELEIDNADGRIAWPKAGRLLTVQLGWAQGRDVRVGMVDKGSFKVDEVSLEGPPDVLTVRARSADMSSAFRVRKDAAYHDTTLGEVVRKVAAANKLAPSITPELASIPVPVLGQTAKSDMALVRELGRRYDAVATVKAGKLIFAPIGAGTTAGGKPITAVTIAASDQDRYRMGEVNRDAYDGVAAAWHDQDGAKRQTVTAGKADGTHKRLHRTFATKADAKAAVSSEWNRIQRGAASLDLALALGRPEIFPDRTAELVGFPPPIQSRKWLIVEATHTMSADAGLETSLRLETK
ncbi:contractile injection system protein, VgrG/Pvc8 family [Sphingomonas sp. PR090111-T3T-6A]|uniref:contractile injection system protein, VgrG/Pvc8 family n=1 Tax=Sphingomonas sp. PR090111-T3T-6A TaxID=685778 RepID=UPI00036CBC5F|nr:contractile injection system protein, VgrG/Pvc8 family [Sphingomonas sp. PR090111-T3T-6A]